MLLSSARSLVLSASVALAFALGGASCGTTRPAELPAGLHIGEPMQSQSIVHFAVVDAEPARHFNKTLLVEGRVKAVCQTKGCWMQIEEGEHLAWVRWESGCGGKYAFPKDAAGKRILVQGSFYPKKISAADAEHLKEEAGGDLVVKTDTYEFNASAVRILD